MELNKRQILWPPPLMQNFWMNPCSYCWLSATSCTREFKYQTTNRLLLAVLEEYGDSSTTQKDAARAVCEDSHTDMTEHKCSSFYFQSWSYHEICYSHLQQEHTVHIQFLLKVDGSIMDGVFSIHTFSGSMHIPSLSLHPDFGPVDCFCLHHGKLN